MLSFVNQENVDYAHPFTKACQTALSTERVAHFFDETHMQLPFLLNEKHPLHFRIHKATIYDGAEARSYFGSILLYDDAVVESHDFTAPTMREIHDNLTESDNIDTQWLAINANLRVVSTLYPRDMTATHLLHK